MVQRRVLVKFCEFVSFRRVWHCSSRITVKETYKVSAAKKAAAQAAQKVVQAGDAVDGAFGWASDVKRAWMFALGAFALGVVVGAIWL